MQRILFLVLCGLALVVANPPQATQDNQATQSNIMQMIQGALHQNNVDMDNLVKKQMEETLRYKTSIASPSGAHMTAFKSGDDLASSLASMLEMEKKTNIEHMKTLLVEKKRHEELNKMLGEQRKKVHDRSVFLERLNMCMTKGPANGNMDQQLKDIQKEKQSIKDHQKDLELGRRELAKKEASLLAHEELAFKQAARVKKTKENEQKSHALLDEGAARVKEELAKINSSETDLARRARLLEEKAQTIAHHEKELDTLLQSVGAQNSRFVELNTAPAVAKNAPCSSFKTCVDCANVGKECGWCQSFLAPAATGFCAPHNVNLSDGDGLTGGQCEIKNWYSRVSDKLNALTLNVYGADDAQKEERLIAIEKTIEAAKYPDFIAFQEMSTWMLERFQKSKWFQTYYFIASYNNQIMPGGMMLLSRFKILRTYYVQQSSGNDVAPDQKPAMFYADVQVNGKTVTIATVKLDWRSGDVRAEALRLLNRVTADTQSLVLMGDFNFDDESEPETSNVSNTWIDLWPTIHPPTKLDEMKRGPNVLGYTWDPQTNWYAKYSDVNSRPSRIDRVYLRSPFLKAREIWLVGCPGPDYLCTGPAEDVDSVKPAMIPFQRRLNQAAPKLVYPSPHYGLLAQFSMFTPHC